MLGTSRLTTEKRCAYVFRKISQARSHSFHHSPHGKTETKCLHPEWSLRESRALFEIGCDTGDQIVWIVDAKVGRAMRGFHRIHQCQVIFSANEAVVTLCILVSEVDRKQPSHYLV